MLIKQCYFEPYLNLDNALCAASAEPPLPALAERTVVATGGDWQPRGWDLDLGMSSGPVATVGLRIAPDEPTPSTHAWARIARTLTQLNRWQSKDWAAVRTSATSMVLVVETDQRPDPARLRAAADVVNRWQTFTGRIPPWTVNPEAGLPAVGPPLGILDARFDRWQRLTVLVPHVPTLDELRFTPYRLPFNPHPRAHHFGTDTLYVATHPGGYVKFLLDTGDGLGNNGEPFDLHLRDGTTQVVVGPWSSNADVVAHHAPATNIHTENILLHDNAEDFLAESPRWAGYLTRAAAQHALCLATRHHPHPAALARAFEPPGLPDATSAVPQTTAHPSHPPPPTTPTRRAR